ncbi:uncharacterized protein N7515_009892 [Penicillium bovifimosum]|uniref:Uncharacterized protein n=1 Tax=Penicillium bovifimosum TaxID=126998 RepID=A0A9W9KUS2_9EURO|nr:uncharacterized protein N7515_009892 [Penicillium bovifimosum]KAJ5120504.1 hypothetical protein N7515_009892 [Penicillium bovifimosum]
MRVQSLLLAGATAATAAQTVTLFLPGFDSQDIHAKVLGSSGSMTTYLLGCPAGTDSNDCGIPKFGVTAIQGVSTATIAYAFGRRTVEEKCSYDSTMAVCEASMDEEGLTTSFSTSVPLTEFPGRVLMPVTITGTQTGAAAAATTGASVSATTAASTGTLATTASTSGTTATGTETNSAAATSTTETGNAAMPMITGNARWAAGGVAAAIALAAL